MCGQSDIFGSNNYLKYVWANYMSEMIFLGPAKTVDTTLIFLGSKVRNTDILGVL